MADRPCNRKWGTCPVYTAASPAAAEPHICGEWYLEGIRHVHICGGCGRPE